MKKLLALVLLALGAPALAADYTETLPMVDQFFTVPTVLHQNTIFQDKTTFVVDVDGPIAFSVKGEDQRACSCTGKGQHFITWKTLIGAAVIIDSMGNMVASLTNVPVTETPQCGAVPSNQICHPGTTDDQIGTVTLAAGTYVLRIDGTASRTSGIGTQYSVTALAAELPTVTTDAQPARKKPER